jgi:Icc-related predicted phosphoesterase
MNDFTQIKDFVPWVFKENERCIKFWNNVEADVFITHHNPTYLGVPKKFKGDRLNCYYVEPRLGNIIMDKQPRYCIQGHSHSSVNYQIGDTKVISNPYGYESSDMRGLNKDFKYDYVIKL